MHSGGSSRLLAHPVQKYYTNAPIGVMGVQRSEIYCRMQSYRFPGRLFTQIRVICRKSSKISLKQPNSTSKKWLFLNYTNITKEWNKKPIHFYSRINF